MKPYCTDNAGSSQILVTDRKRNGGRYFIVAIKHALAKLASTGGEFTLQMKRIAGNGVATNPVHYRDE